MARLRGAPVAPPSTIATKPAAKTRTALKEKTNVTKSTRARDTALESDHRDFIKDAVKPRRAGRRGAAQDEATLVMAGGLGTSDAPEAVATEAGVILTDPVMTTDELAKSDSLLPATAKPRGRQLSMARNAPRESTARISLPSVKQPAQPARKGRTAGLKIAQHEVDAIETSSDPLPGQRRSKGAVPERSEFSISPSPPPPGKLQSLQKRTSVAAPSSVLRPQPTPAAEHSVLALKNFKRRPRQGSMLAMVQNRTASARPSLLHAHPQVEEDPSVFDIEIESGDEEDFAPEAEGTPAHLAKAKRSSKAPRRSTPLKAAARVSTANTKKRKSDQVEGGGSSLSSLSSKRHKPRSEQVTEHQSHDDEIYLPEQVQSSARRHSPLPLQATSDIQVLNSSLAPSSTPPTEPSSSTKQPALSRAELAIPSTEEQQLDGDDDLPSNPLDTVYEAHHATLAEPISSPTPPAETSTQGTDIYADPLTQVSPPPRSRAPQTKAKAKTVSTATLQSLLPKRKAPPRSKAKQTEYDIPSDSGEADESAADEDAEAEDRGARRRRTVKATPVKSKKIKAKVRPSRAPLSARKSTAAANKSAKPARTYGRKPATPAAADKENEDYDVDEEDEEVTGLHDSTATFSGLVQSKELESVRQKFEEVDEWEMSFESMSAEDHRSSSQGWR
ncbi:hypothetical protein B0A48_09296 [Cryoendolithus antarcticus]|uniref:Uncharacterized protein n=1 Tax=Cryoendolithus antarcticus TaxID=1507870 RepID=A0A1V8T281_9PEZI|nr:hypothetical protein B0A48_09296 [Cryoendolithus antarcticus]